VNALSGTPLYQTTSCNVVTILVRGCMRQPGTVGHTHPASPTMYLAITLGRTPVSLRVRPRTDIPA